MFEILSHQLEPVRWSSGFIFHQQMSYFGFEPVSHTTSLTPTTTMPGHPPRPKDQALGIALIPRTWSKSWQKGCVNCRLKMGNWRGRTLDWRRTYSIRGVLKKVGKMNPMTMLSLKRDLVRKQPENAWRGFVRKGLMGYLAMFVKYFFCSHMGTEHTLHRRNERQQHTTQPIRFA